MTILYEHTVASSSISIFRSRKLLLGAVVIIWFTTYFLRLAWVNVSASPSQTLGLSATAMGSFLTFFFVGYVVANVAGGFLVDRFGPKSVVTTALCILAIATFCFSRVTTTTQAWSIQFIMGLSCGSFYAAVIKLIAAWFKPSERGTASGLLFAAGPFAVIVANLVYPFILRGWNWASLYVLLSFYVALVAGLAMLLIKDGGGSSALVSGKSLNSSERNPSVLNLNLILLCGACFGTGWGTWGFTFCSNVLLVRSHLGLNEGAAAIVALWFGLGGVVVIPIYGRLSDRYATKRPHLYILALILMIVALFVFSGQTTLAGFCAAALFLGMAAYAFLPVLGALLPDLVVPRTLGATAGITNAAGQLAAAAAPLAIGTIIDRSGSISLSLTTLAVGPAVGIICLMTLLVLNRHGMVSASGRGLAGT